MTTTAYLVNIALIGLVLLQIRGRRLTRAALLVPVMITVWVASQYLHGIPTAGNDVLLEVGLALTGATLGVLAGLTTRIRLDGGVGVAKAGLVAAVLWVVGVGSRMAFSVWASHGGAPAIVRFSMAHHITSSATWTAAFVLMALAEVLGRTGVLYVKTRRTGAVIPRGGLLRPAAA